MPEISLLEPTVLTGLIEKFVAPPEMIAHGLFPARSYPETVAKWDVIQGSRERAVPTLPNREGKMVAQMGVGQKTSTFIYVREKKAFEPTTLRWLREPGELAAKNAEAQIRREAADLNNRVDRFVESMCWDALKGTITINEVDVKATVDFGISGAHKPTAGVHWSQAGADIIGNVKAWKKLLAQDSGSEASDIYLNSTAMDLVYGNTAIMALVTDRIREQYLGTGNITGLLGLNWHIFDGGYVNAGGSFVGYLSDINIIMIARGGSPFYLLEGLSADESAPRNHTGKYAKTWKTEDPSGVFMLEEYNFMPVIEKPDAIVYAVID